MALRVVSAAFRPSACIRTAPSLGLRAASSTTSSSPYSVLGVAPGAEAAAVKKAYRAKVKALHPDVNPSPTAAAQFQAVQEAYEALSGARPVTPLADRVPQARAYSVEELNARAARFQAQRAGSACHAPLRPCVPVALSHAFHSGSQGTVV